MKRHNPREIKQAEGSAYELRSLFWKNKIKNFIFKSDEKWILSQYNLLKIFLFQNSIEVDSPVEVAAAETPRNQNESQGLKEALLEKESTRTSREDSKKLVKMEEIKLNLKPSKTEISSLPILKKMTHQNFDKKEGVEKIKVFDV